MKICLISQNVSPGLLIFRKDFIRYLVSCGHEVYAFALDYTPSTKKEVESLGATPVLYRLSKTGTNPITDIRDTYQLYKLIKQRSPDVVFSFFVKPSIYGTIAAKLANVPYRVAMLEGLGYTYTSTVNGITLKKRVLQYIHGFLCSVGYSFADKVLFLNTDDPKDLSRVAFFDRSKSEVFGPIGLDLHDYPFSEPDLNKPIRFIFVARLLAEKGVFEYIAAARLVKEQFPNADFVILGGLDSDNPAALSKAQLDDIVKEGVVIYPGHVNDVQEWVRDSHVFVLPSYREGYPRSTQEAMAIGRAVITTDVPGCRETVFDEVNGFIVPPWNAECLAERMVFLIEHPQEIKRMGQESYRIALEKFDIHKINPVLARIITGNNG